MSGLCSAVLGSTPPLSAPTPSPCVRTSGSKRVGNNLVSFRSSLSDDHVGSSLKGGLRGSFTENSSYSLSRSLGRHRSSAASEASAALGSSSTNGTAASSSVAARPLQHTASIPKSAAFVKIEGFNTRESSPADPVSLLSSSISDGGSAPPSPQQPRCAAFPSLLSRQLSTDRMPSLSLGMGSDDPFMLNAAIQAHRIEQQTVVRVAPVPRPVPLSSRRTSVPSNLLQQLQDMHSVFQEAVCIRAFNIARFAHDGKYRASGEPAFMHSVEVARILAELGADEGTVSAALLHDVLDKTLLVEGQLRPMLQEDSVVELVKQVAHLGDISSKYRACPATSPDGQTATASQLVGMLVAMGCNHALLVKLGDRLHDMRTLGALPAAKRNRLAQETIDVWAPLANRLGVWSLKAQLEDLAFKQLYPGQYAELRSRLEQVQSANVLVGLMDRMRAEMQRLGISYHDLSGRPKHLWGVYKKMLNKGYTLGRISDVRGLRIIVDTKADCYRALRAVEKLWKEVGPTKDYIRNPKENGYRSLHTVVRGEDGHDIEIQIRTAKMHFFAEYGAEAAHWQYKERGYGPIVSVDETDMPAAAAAPAAAVPQAGAGAAREANWAKFVLSRQVFDQKYRPSGSPSQDNSLAGIVGAATAAASGVGVNLQPHSGGSEDTSPSGSPLRDERFAAYLERSGQMLEPPPAERVVVAVVCNGGLTIEELPEGTTLLSLIQRQALGLRDTQVLVNKQVESNPSTKLRTGDIIDLYPEMAPAAAAPTLTLPPSGAGLVLPLRPQQQQPGVRVGLVAANNAVKGPLPSAGRSNVVSLGGLKARLRTADAS